MSDEQAFNHVGHDFDPVNRFIDNEAERHQQLLKDRVANRWWRHAKTFVLFALATGLFLVLAALALWILNLNSSDGVKVYNIGGSISEDQVASLDQALSDIKKEVKALGLDRQKEQELIKKIKDSESLTQSDPSVTVNFTVFQSVEVDSKTDIVTGRNYHPDNTSYPYQQYCYQSTQGEGVTSSRIDLARKEQNQKQEYFSISKKLKRLAKTHCKFI